MCLGRCFFASERCLGGPMWAPDPGSGVTQKGLRGDHHQRARRGGFRGCQQPLGQVKELISS